MKQKTFVFHLEKYFIYIIIIFFYWNSDSIVYDWCYVIYQLIKVLQFRIEIYFGYLQNSIKYKFDSNHLSHSGYFLNEYSTQSV